MWYGYSYLFPFIGGVPSDFDSDIMSTLYNSDVILLFPPFLLGLSQSKCESKEDEEKQLDYDKEPNYRTATVNTNFNPKRKSRTGESKSYPLTRLPSDKEENHLPYSYYSALIGLLASSGARLEHGPVVSR